MLSESPDAKLIEFGREFEIAGALANELDDKLQATSDRAWSDVKPAKELAFRKSDRAVLDAYGLSPPGDALYSIGEISVFRFGRHGLSDKIRARKGEIVAAWDQWIAAVSLATADAGGTAIKSQYDEATAAAIALGKQIMLTPACTVDGAIVKARVVRWCNRDEPEYRTGEFTDCNVVDSLIADLLAMAPPAAPQPSSDSAMPRAA
jgi:hypothetical protein